MKKFAYATCIVAAAFVIAIASSSTGEAKSKKKMAAPPAQPQVCLAEWNPVCGKRGGMMFTYANACSAYKDGAAIVSKKACSAKPMHAKKAKKAKKAMKKPAKKADMKKMDMKK